MPRPSDTIGVWHVDLDDWGDGRFDSLSADEQARAERYATALLARRFRAGRAALRQLLGERCGVDPARIVFSANRYGKPQLAWPPVADVHFNVSHTGRHALIALGPSALGVDIEAVRPDHPIDDLIGLVCHPDERQHLDGLPRSQRSLAFYRLWTRKEAYCKATGSGLQAALETLSFASTPNAEGMRVLDAGALQDGWIVRNVAAPTGCVASLCLLDDAKRISSPPRALQL